MTFPGTIRAEGMCEEAMRDEMGEEGKGIFSVSLKDLCITTKRGTLFLKRKEAIELNEV